ncbi:hypothetical protein [Streptomyces sp. NPDC019507]|uniref:hypothetical protein n=1 Tax=Streptomyces sp. NPDC019507 TaxID=3154689 RepID=UPI0033E61E4A
MKFKAASIAAASIALAGVASAPAVASPNLYWIVQCQTTGSEGFVKYSPISSSTTRIDVRLGVWDEAADGHHSRVRLITKNKYGGIVYYSWRSDTNGANNGKLNWDTYASDTDGIKDVGVQVATYEGDTQLYSCTDWTEVRNV